MVKSQLESIGDDDVETLQVFADSFGSGTVPCFVSCKASCSGHVDFADSPQDLDESIHVHLCADRVRDRRGRSALFSHDASDPMMWKAGDLFDEAVSDDVEAVLEVEGQSRVTSIRPDEVDREFPSFSKAGFEKQSAQSASLEVDLRRHPTQLNRSS